MRAHTSNRVPAEVQRSPIGACLVGAVLALAACAPAPDTSRSQPDVETARASSTNSDSPIVTQQPAADATSRSEATGGTTPSDTAPSDTASAATPDRSDTAPSDSAAGEGGAATGDEGAATAGDGAASGEGGAATAGDGAASAGDGAASGEGGADSGEEGAATSDDGTQVLPPVTFPDASIRDPEAEAADLERRRSVIGLFERLRVEAEQRRGYDRDAVFGGWLYSNGRSTRDRVLAAERRPDSTWLSLYDNVSVSSASDFDIDHMVPLAEAWESGGYRWTADTWTRFANDLGDPRSLIAVTASSNRSKSARDPAQWWPPEDAYRCQYAADWVAVKARWDLAVDSVEQRVLDDALDSCTGGEFDFSAPQPAATTSLTGEPEDSTTDEAVADEAEADQAEADEAEAGEGEPGDGESTDAAENASAGNDCHPAYEPCLPNLPGDAINCGDLTAAQKPVMVKVIGEDPYRLDRDGNGVGCQS
ncbi:HNH endonuclease family protein [Candidatus Poriferisodalis sp.]|uniref:HNH endonuclease family protein n=1 Tax=Candidatus Poriferisodalis sp. TaxID=3101277 RepID=UPI003AF98110